MDMADLEAKLKEAQGARIRMIATDGVFSMDGDIAPLKEIRSLANKYRAVVFVDECHATGFFGPTGRGTDEHCGILGKIDIINSTLGKALGGATGETPNLAVMLQIQLLVNTFWYERYLLDGTWAILLSITEKCKL